MSRFFCVFRVWKKCALYALLSVKWNSDDSATSFPCSAKLIHSAMSATLSLQLTNRPINDSETVYFVIQDHHLIGSCIVFGKIVRVVPVVLQGVPPGGEKKH